VVSNRLLAKLHLTAREQIVPLSFGFHLPGKIEKAAVLHGIEEGSPLRPGVGQKHGGGKMPRAGDLGWHRTLSTHGYSRGDTSAGHRLAETRDTENSSPSGLR